MGVTECPRCATRFRVTAEQLRLARGRVRCGSCLVVFDARVALRRDDEIEEASLEELLEDFEAEVEAHPRPEAVTANQAQDTSDPAPDPSDQGADAREPASYATELAPDAVDQSSEAAGETSNDADEHPDAAQGALAAPDPVADTPEPLAGAAERTSEELPEAALGSPDLSSDSPDEQADGIEDEPNRSGRDETEFRESPIGVPAVAENAAEPRRRPASKEDARLTGVQRAQLDALAPAPPPTPPRRARGNGVWIVSAALLALFLVVQAGWWNRMSWTQDPVLRPWYEQICTLAGCTLPVRLDHEGLAIRRVVLRNDPEDLSRVLVDALLVNNSNEARVWPVLQLAVTGAHDRPLGARRFLPEEYLSGELAGALVLPPRTPVRVSLALRSPGDFTSYSLTLAR